MAAEHLTTDEVWKSIPRLPGHEVSDQGRIRSYWKRVNTFHGATRHLVSEPRILNPTVSARGYHTIRAMDNQGVHRTCQLHRLVLEVFVGPCPDGHEGCHKDGSRTNSVLDNLYWGTRRDNCGDTRRHGRMKIKFSDTDKDKMVEMSCAGMTGEEIADHFDASQGHVSKVLIDRGLRTQRTNFTADEIQTAITFRRENVSIAEVAKRLSTTPKVLDSILRRALGTSVIKPDSDPLYVAIGEGKKRRRNLSEEERKLLFEMAGHGFPVNEIAKRLNATPGMIRWRINHDSRRTRSA